MMFKISGRPPVFIWPASFKSIRLRSILVNFGSKSVISIMFEFYKYIFIQNIDHCAMVSELKNTVSMIGNRVQICEFRPKGKFEMVNVQNEPFYSSFRQKKYTTFIISEHLSTQVFTRKTPHGVKQQIIFKRRWLKIPWRLRHLDSRGFQHFGRSEFW